MNKILKLSAIALLASSVSAMAQKTGASIAVFGAIAGAEVEASGNAGTGNGSGSGSAGKVTPVGGFDIGYNFNPNIAIGATYIPMDAKIGTGSVDGGTVSGKLKDHYTIYIEPAYVVNKDASLYARIQYAHADLTLTGATGSNKLEGYGVGVGLKTFLNANTFVRAEANYTEYDSISGKNVTSNGGAATTTTVSGTPYLAQGIISIGYQF